MEKFRHLCCLAMIVFLLSACFHAPSITPSRVALEKILGTPAQSVRLTLLAQLPNPLSNVAWSPDGRFISYSSWDGRTHLYNVDALATVWQVDQVLEQLVFSPDGTQIAGFSLLILDAKDGHVINSPLHYGRLCGVQPVYSSDGSIILGTSCYGFAVGHTTIETWDSELKESTTILELDGALGDMVVTANGKLLAVGLWEIDGVVDNDRVQVFEFPSMNPLCEFPGDKAQFGQTGDLLVTEFYDDESYESTISIFDVSACRVIKSITIGRSEFPFPSPFAISPDENFLIYAEAPCCVISFLEIATGTVVHQESLPENIFRYFTFSPDNRYLISMSWDFGQAHTEDDWYAVGTGYKLQIWSVTTQ